MGGLLAGEKLRAVLLEGRVFDPESISMDNVRGACYDLRLASDRLIAPDGLDDGGSVIRQSGALTDRPLILKPGDTAFISTIERARFDWSVAGVVGAKFRLASQGLLVLHGLAVDPGYGLRSSPDGVWEPMPDQRLHMVVANVGGEIIALPPGSSIAVLQLFEVDADASLRFHEIESPGLERFEDEYFEEGGRATTGLVFFRNVRDASDRAQELLTKVEGVKTEAEQLLTRVESIEVGSKFVVTFGVFLIAVTLVSVFLTLLLDVIAHFPKRPSLLLSIAAIGSGTVMAVTICVAVVAGVRRLR